jgi:hypothetical protein
VPNFALVQEVGCLARGPGQAWMLNKTNEPAVTRPAVTKEDTQSTPDMHDAVTQLLGTQSFVLVSAGAFSPVSHVGHKMEARSLLCRDLRRPSTARVPDHLQEAPRHVAHLIQFAPLDSLRIDQIKSQPIPTAAAPARMKSAPIC